MVETTRICWKGLYSTKGVVCECVEVYINMCYVGKSLYSIYYIVCVCVYIYMYNYYIMYM